MNENELSGLVVDLCYKIHYKYGPGLFESVYEEIFCYEWNKKNIEVRRQQGIRFVHDGIDMGIGFIPDLVLGNKIVLELKSVERVAEVHLKQLTTYLKLTGLKLGLLINFNVSLIKDGIYRRVNQL